MRVWARGGWAWGTRGRGCSSRLQEGAADIVDERAALELRLDAIEARYRRQFNALDTLLNEISGTGAMVTNQLANIPIPGQAKK